MTSTDHKKGLRAEARGKPVPTPDESQAVCQNVLAWLKQRPPAPTLIWMAMPGELDLDLVVSRVPEIEWLTTRTPSHGSLTVHSYHSETELHRYGFRQPVIDSPVVSPERIGIALVPGVMFDRQGGRLGRGKSYYDRLLAGTDPTAPRVGVTLERLLVEALPQEPHDIPMTHLITDRGVLEVASAKGSPR